jgi:hypothetical protein
MNCLEELLDVPRPSAPESITTAPIEEVVTRTLVSMPEKNSTHWINRLANKAGLSRTVVLRRWRAFGLLVLLLLLIAGFRSQHHPRTQYVQRKVQVALPVPERRHHSYSTNFPATEMPLFESGRWIDGKAVGFDWTSVAAVGGLAYGTESGAGRGDKSYDDAVALLMGPWGPDQTVEARVHSVNPSEGVFEEVELRLRSSLSAHTSTGYEVLFRCLNTPKAYASIVRWDGPLGTFKYLDQKYGLQYGLGDGDVVKATVVGNVIAGYINGVQVLSASDSTFASGSPGIGFWMQRQSGLRAWLTAIRANNTDYGFTSFAAWD